MNKERTVGNAPVLIGAAVIALVTAAVVLVRVAPETRLSLWLRILAVVALIVVLLVLFILLITRDEDRSVGDFAREFLAPPLAVVKQNLGPTEHLIHVARPSAAAFIVRNLAEFGIAVGVLALACFAGYVIGGVVFVFLPLFVLATEIVVFMVMRFSEYYTLYVFTDDRVMKLEGVINRSNSSINWERVTDISWEQKLWGRLFGFATLKVASASEKSTLKELPNIPNRFRVNQVVTERLDLQHRRTTGPSGS